MEKQESRGARAQRHIARGAALSAMALLGTALPAAAQQRPTVLGTLGGPSAEAEAINEAGAIVGTAQVRASNGRIREQRATWYGFYTAPGGAPVQVDVDGRHAQPNAVNRHGLVVGIVAGSNAIPYGSILWSAEGGGRMLPAPEGHARPLARDVDDRGRILFSAIRDEGGRTPYLYDSVTEKVTELPCEDCDVVAMNEAGDILLAPPVDSRRQPLLLRAGASTPVELPEIAGLVYSWVADINERGTIVGVAYDADGTDHVVSWSGPRHVGRDHGPGVAFGLNDHDVVAGARPVIVDGEEDRRATLFDLTRDRRIELPELEVELYESVAADINNLGVAVGTATTPDGSSYALLYPAYAPHARPADPPTRGDGD